MPIKITVKKEVEAKRLASVSSPELRLISILLSAPRPKV